MPVSIEFPRITMELYETDMYELQKFIENEKLEGEFTEEYLILYNFADDCRFAEFIQPELLKYLLPFYLKTIEQAVIRGNKVAIDIYFQFNMAIFYNKKVIGQAVGKKCFSDVMVYYINQTIKCMESEHIGILDWISLYNTTLAFSNNNIRRLFGIISKGSLKIKFSFFQYLSVLLFKESDNLLAVNESNAFWASDIWDFADGYFTNKFYWSDCVVDFFDKEINRERIEVLFNEVKPLIYEILEPELVNLFIEEMNLSFDKRIFNERKAEYLRKIKNKSKEYTYWDKTF